jgi:hypothetical protein
MSFEPLVDGEVGDVLAHIVVLIVEVHARTQNERLLVHQSRPVTHNRGVASEVELLAFEQNGVVHVPTNTLMFER